MALIDSSADHNLIMEQDIFSGCKQWAFISEIHQSKPLMKPQQYLSLALMCIQIFYCMSPCTSCDYNQFTWALDIFNQTSLVSYLGVSMVKQVSLLVCST